MRHGGEARTMPGSAAIGLPRARIHIYTNTNPTLVRSLRHRHIPRAILTLAGRQLAAHLTTARHVRTGKRRSWTVSIVSRGLGGQCSLSGSSSLSLSLALWGKDERKQLCHPFHTRQLQSNTRVASLYSLFPVPVSTINLVRPLSPPYPALASPSPASTYPSRVQVIPPSKPFLLPRARQVSHQKFAQTA